VIAIDGCDTGTYIEHDTGQDTGQGTGCDTEHDTGAITVTVRLFASLKEAFGMDETLVTLPARATVAILLKELKAEWPDLSQMLDHVLQAREGDYLTPDDILCDRDTIALYPPLSGG